MGCKKLNSVFWDNLVESDGVGDGRGLFRSEGTYVMNHLWLIHADVCQRPTKYCKAIILPLKKKPTRVPSSHHIELPPDGRPLSQGRGDLLYEGEVAWDDRFMLPGRKAKGRDSRGFIKQKGTLPISHAGHSAQYGANGEKTCKQDRAHGGLHPSLRATSNFCTEPENTHALPLWKPSTSHAKVR